jgi:hypothetical protein
MLRVTKTALHRNIRHTPLGGREHSLRLLDTQTHDISKRRLPRSRLKGSNEMPRTNAGHTGQIVNCEGLGEIYDC